MRGSLKRPLKKQTELLNRIGRKNQNVGFFSLFLFIKKENCQIWVFSILCLPELLLATMSIASSNMPKTTTLLSLPLTLLLQGKRLQPNVLDILFVRLTGYCVNYSTVNAVLEAARDIKSPIIIQFSNGGSSFYAGKGLSNANQQAAVLGAVAGAHVSCRGWGGGGAEYRKQNVERKLIYKSPCSTSAQLRRHTASP